MLFLFPRNYSPLTHSHAIPMGPTEPMEIPDIDSPLPHWGTSPPNSLGYRPPMRISGTGTALSGMQIASREFRKTNEEIRRETRLDAETRTHERRCN